MPASAIALDNFVPDHSTRANNQETSGRGPRRRVALHPALRQLDQSDQGLVHALRYFCLDGRPRAGVPHEAVHRGHNRGAHDEVKRPNVD